ncbi:MAG: lipoyl(octanoyl) transferase LipB [Anaerolineae bacterium]|nr:lipoyl(octanoyl) transferase LipB [Phycisphaerae bacterium]
MKLIDLGPLGYRDAWKRQEDAHAEVVAGAEEQLLLVEHPPVITFGRRAEIAGQKNLITPREMLSMLGVEIIQSDRGGDVTFHGPGQIVAYPIVRLNDHGLSVGGFVRRLEETVIATLKSFHIPAQKDDCAIGVWAPNPDGALAKICALGVRIRRGVSLHGIALNVTIDLTYFKLIIPCGLTGRAVTSMKQLLGHATPPIDLVKARLAERMLEAFGGRAATRST